MDGSLLSKIRTKLFHRKLRQFRNHLRNHIIEYFPDAVISEKELDTRCMEAIALMESTEFDSIEDIHDGIMPFLLKEFQYSLPELIDTVFEDLYKVSLQPRYTHIRWDIHSRCKWMFTQDIIERAYKRGTEYDVIKDKLNDMFIEYFQEKGLRITRNIFNKPIIQYH